MLSNGREAIQIDDSGDDLPENQAFTTGSQRFQEVFLGSMTEVGTCSDGLQAGRWPCYFTPRL